MLTVVSVQPDLFCREDPQASVGGPFCARCGRGIMRPAGQSDVIAWCYGCGVESGSLPLSEEPMFWGDFSDAITFDEAQRMKTDDFDPLKEEYSHA